jgi:hypothetical protein
MNSIASFYKAPAKLGGGAGPSPPAFDDGEAHDNALVRAAGDGMAALATLKTDTSQCSELSHNAGGFCSSSLVINKIQAVAGTLSTRGISADASAKSTLPGSAAPEAVAFREVAKAVGCTTELCTLRRVKKHLPPDARREVDNSLRLYFKTVGPRNSTELLSNVHIDKKLQEWAAANPAFFNYDFNMMDFASTGGSLSRINPVSILEGRAKQDLGAFGGRVRRPCRHAACVLNTDVSSGKGKHWVAIHVDMRPAGEDPWTLAYYNSAGNPPAPTVTEWLTKSSADLLAYRKQRPDLYGSGDVYPMSLTDTRHQDSQTECGPYALFFIRSCLDGDPPSKFIGTSIPDSVMIEFRKHLFRGEF